MWPSQAVDSRISGTPADLDNDCGAALLPMPASANDRPCSGKGTPVAVMGQCLCFTGWSGAGCDSCAEGYAPLAGVCQRTPESFAAEAKLNARRHKVGIGCVPAMPSCCGTATWSTRCQNGSPLHAICIIVMQARKLRLAAYASTSIVAAVCMLAVCTLAALYVRRCRALR